MSIAITRILLNRPPSFAIGISARQRTTERASNLHMAGCDASGNHRLGARSESRNSPKRHILWFCIGITGAVQCELSYAWNWYYMFWSTWWRRSVVIVPSQIPNRRLYGYQYNTAKSSTAAATTATLLKLQQFRCIFLLSWLQPRDLWFVERSAFTRNGGAISSFSSVSARYG